MNKLPHLKKYSELLLVHLIFWAMVAAYVILSNQPETLIVEGATPEEMKEIALQEKSASQQAIWNAFFLIIFKTIFFYANVYLTFPKYVNRRSKWKLLLLLGVGFSWCFITETVFFTVIGIIDFLPPGAGEYPLYFRYDIVKDGLLPFTVVLILSFGYWVTKQWLRQKAGLEKLDVTVAELALLKNQVNPHFLFNTLNNLFSMAIEKNADELAESIAQLTHLMRYSIYESNVPFIELQREIEYIENYIKLQKLRFSGDEEILIRFEVEGDLQRVRVSPMLLINFVENAFKHGISLKQESYILIDMRTTESELYFTVENTIHRQSKTASVAHAGFGLEHVKKLLQLQYPNRHTLSIMEEGNIYKSMLRLELQKTKVEITALQ